MNDAEAIQAQTDLATAYDAAEALTDAVNVAGDLGGLTLGPGLYKSTSSLSVVSGDLTLDAGGDASAVFIFQVESSFVVGDGRQVILTGGAKASHVYWQVGDSATLGAGAAVTGNLLVNQSITMNNGATLNGNGRALARSGAVTLDTNIIVIPQ